MAWRKHTLFLYFCFCSILSSSYSETDTLKQGHQLKDGEYLISAGRVFTLGFFSPKQEETVGYFTPENVRNRFIGIWYTYSQDKKPVWVANRNKPFSKGSAVLEIDSNGDLRILDHWLNPILLKTNGGAARTVAVLTDTGNFVLQELNPDGSAGDKILWQSFDYPTDTLLPGMRLGFNFKTGHNWSINSWLSDKIPALGPFTLGADPNGTNQLIMWRRGKIHWISGVWNGSKFSYLRDELYSFEYVSNKDERYFTLSAVDNWYISFPMYRINGEGVISNSDFSQRGRQGLSLFSLVNCRARFNDQNFGCVKQKLPKCRSKKRFYRCRGYILRDGFKDENEKGNYILGVADCEARCLSNCSCLAYASKYPNGTGCQFWSDTAELAVVDGYADSYRELYIQGEEVLIVEPRQRFWWIWFLVGTAGFVLLLPLAWLGYRIRRTVLKVARCCYLIGYIVQQRLKTYFLRLQDHAQRILEAGTRQIEEQILPSELDSSAGYSAGLRRTRKLRIGKKQHGTQLFSLESIIKATDNFSSSNVLGQGGYGIVYKGVLKNGQQIAIKRLSKTSKQGGLEFKNEVKLVAKLQHTNLVRLIGYCNEQGEKMVVYEYMQNKSLDYFLFDSGRKLLLDWRKRFNIIEGVAQGLLYLHKYSRLKIIHRDLKSGNILLDQDMNPKISDFGMAKLFGQNESGANTNRVVGTLGYMSPEYARDGYFSVKSDVFSFGILMLEVISSKKNSGSYSSDRPLNLVGYAWELWMENRGSELIDQTLMLSGRDHVQAMKCINVGLLCVQEHPADRPTMSTVVAMVSNIEATELPKPKKPAFFIGKGLPLPEAEHLPLPEAEHLPHDLEHGSLNGASISDMEAR